MRHLTVAEKAALSADRVEVCYLVDLWFPAGVVRFTTHLRTLTYGVGLDGLPAEWLGAGGLLDIQLPHEDGTLEAHKCEITLDGLDPTVISLALNEDIESSPCGIYLATFDPDTHAVIGAHLFHRGTVGQVRIVPPSSSEQ
jgi:hypothetical protein